MLPRPIKPWYLSKTVWANLITLVLATFSTMIESRLIDPEQMLILTGLLLPILNLVLRWLTDEPITSPAVQMDGLRPMVRANPNKFRIGRSNHRLHS